MRPMIPLVITALLANAADAGLTIPPDEVQSSNADAAVLVGSKIISDLDHAVGEGPAFLQAVSAHAQHPIEGGTPSASASGAVAFDSDSIDIALAASAAASGGAALALQSGAGYHVRFALDTPARVTWTADAAITETAPLSAGFSAALIAGDKRFLFAHNSRLDAPEGFVFEAVLAPGVYHLLLNVSGGGRVGIDDPAVDAGIGLTSTLTIPAPAGGALALAAAGSAVIRRRRARSA